jgi:hypothetical protein
MDVLDLILLIVAGVCFLLASLNVTSPRVQLLALGLLAWVLVPLIDAARAID